MKIVDPAFIVTTTEVVERKSLNQEKWLDYAWIKIREIVDDRPVRYLLASNALNMIGKIFLKPEGVSEFSIGDAERFSHAVSYYENTKQTDWRTRSIRAKGETLKIALELEDEANFIFREDSDMHQRTKNQNLDDVSNFLINYSGYIGTVGYLLSNHIQQAKDHLFNHTTDEGLEEVPDNIYLFITDKAEQLSIVQDKKKTKKLSM